ncbi:MULTISPECIES: MCE family protein [unclassified Mycobacterium]|uniref:MCE family protein n=1 Tax=unclassified Mycobacterium TaxID=2642494 RepID=UPI0029C6DB25|nr:MULTISPECIES: MCE family protein [unclassified Mycobacterium]
MPIRAKRPLEGYNKIVLGAISVGVIVAVVAVVVGIGRLSLGQTGFRGEFAQAAQIRPGDQVTVAGISVGAVKGVELAGDHVVVSFKVSDDVRLGRDTQAAIKLTTLLGSRYLELSPAGDGDLDHNTIGMANTSVPYDLQKAVADATTTFEQVDGDRIADSLTTLAGGLTGVPEALPEALDNIKSLAAIISGRRDQIGSLLSSVDTITTMIRNQKANLGSLVQQGRALLAEITTRRAAVQGLLTNATALVNRIKSVLDDEPAINEMIASSRDFSRMIAEHDELVRQTMQVMAIDMRAFANASGSGTALDANVPSGPLIDSWMCALSARAKQFNLQPYFTDCQPAADPFPGWPPPDGRGTP